MEVKHKILLPLAVLFLIAAGGYIVLGDHGLYELRHLKADHLRLVEKNEGIGRQNFALLREIERLRNDTAYIENVARQLLGFIGKDEIVVKANDASGKNP